jgi:hypothetical protein
MIRRRIPRLSILVVAATIALSGLLAGGVGGVTAPDRAEAASLNWGWNSVSLKFNRAETRCLARYTCRVDGLVGYSYLLSPIRSATAVRAYWALYHYGCNLKIVVTYSDIRVTSWGLWNCG